MQIRESLYTCLTILPIMEHKALTNWISIPIMNKISTIIFASLVAAGWPVIAAAQIDDETAMPPKRGPGRGGPGGPGGFGGPGSPPPGGGNPPGLNGPGPSGSPN